MDDLLKVSQNVVTRLQQARNNNELGRYRAIIMHDFSLDHLVHLDSYEDFDQRARTILSQKGGLLPKSRQTLQQGGCAANTATTLARLGIDTHFITRIDEVGLTLLKFYLEQVGVSISRVKLGGSLALMTALEIGPEKINIMINDADSFGPFGFDDLDAGDLQLIESADLVGVFDWCLNPKGTDLAGRLFKYLEGKKIITYMDTSDPAPRKMEIPELFERVFVQPGLAYLNVNENELKQYAGSPQIPDSSQSLLKLAQSLKARIPAALNVHTANFAMSVDDSFSQVIPTYQLHPLRTTGAGDSWNGGNILGLLLNLDPAERLLLANAVAGYYIISPVVRRPDLDEIIDFIKNYQHRMRDLEPEKDTG